MKKQENGKKRLAIDIDLNLHCEIKKRAAMRNVTVTDYVILSIIMRMQDEKKYE